MKKYLFLCTLIAFQFSLLGQQRVKVMHYNLLQYGSPEPCAPSLASKDSWLRNIVSHYQPDIFTVNEMAPNIAYANRIRQLVFNFTSMNHGQLTNQAGANLANMIFYKTELFGYDAEKSVVIANPVRDINVYALYELASALAGDTTYLYCIVGHLKAGQSTADATARGIAAQSISDWIAAEGQSKNILLMGDMNIYFPSEAAYQALVLNSDTTRRLLDPTGLTSGWGSVHAIHMTQSTRSNATDCGSGGGMDDRFDFIFANSTLWRHEAGIRYVPGSYAAFGNDGLSYNGPLNCSNNTPVPSSICTNLVQMSDHLPVVMEIEFDATTRIAPHASIPGLALRVLGQTSREQLTLELVAGNPSSAALQLALYDMQGRRQLSRALLFHSQTLQIPVSSLAPGIYLLRISDASGRGFSRRVQVH